MVNTEMAMAVSALMLEEWIHWENNCIVLGEWINISDLSMVRYVTS